MASIIDNLNASYAAQALALARMDANKPDYSLDGESYQWTQQRESLIRSMRELKALIQIEAGPFVVMSQGRT